MEKNRKPSPIFTIEGLEPSSSTTGLLKSSLTIFSELIDSMNISGLEILIGCYEDKPVKVMAEQLDISVQGVYKHIRSNDMLNLVFFMKNVEQILNECLRNE